MVSNYLNLQGHGSTSSFPTRREVTPLKGRAAHGAGRGQPEAGGKEFLHARVGFDAVSPAVTASEEVKCPTKKIKPLASKGRLVPFPTSFRLITVVQKAHRS